MQRVIVHRRRTPPYNNSTGHLWYPSRSLAVSRFLPLTCPDQLYNSLDSNTLILWPLSFGGSASTIGPSHQVIQEFVSPNGADRGYHLEDIRTRTYGSTDIMKACLNIAMYQRLRRSFAIISSSPSRPWLCKPGAIPTLANPAFPSMNYDTNSTRLELGCISHRSAFTINSEAAKLAGLPRIGSLSVLTGTNLPPGLQDSWRARQGEQLLTP